ncbi:MAG: DUF4843 domain-containing protein [Bacteroidaceae bacterium]|nr:DUF4843 domain-containing protein [Bacteroidaceae bacterium]
MTNEAMKNYNYIIGAFAFTLTITACEDENYMKFDTSYTGIYFVNDSAEYSFSVTPIDIREYTLKIPVQIMGTPTKEARPIGYELVAHESTAIEGVQYIIDEAIIHPDSIMGYIPIRILRNGLKGSYAEGYERYTLTLRLTKNTYFTPTLDSLNQVHRSKFDNAVEQPAWYNAHGEKVWQKIYLGEWHPYKFIKMVEYFHAFKEIQPETYKKMVALYGENLEHIEYGDPYQYRTIFRKHIYLPMYEHFNDPANRELILAEYPDFPFDFPHPFAV